MNRKSKRQAFLPLSQLNSNSVLYLLCLRQFVLVEVVFVLKYFFKKNCSRLLHIKHFLLTNMTFCKLIWWQISCNANVNYMTKSDSIIFSKILFRSLFHSFVSFKSPQAPCFYMIQFIVNPISWKLKSIVRNLPNIRWTEMILWRGNYGQMLEWERKQSLECDFGFCIFTASKNIARQNLNFWDKNSE